MKEEKKNSETQLTAGILKTRALKSNLFNLLCVSDVPHDERFLCLCDERFLCLHDR